MRTVLRLLRALPFFSYGILLLVLAAAPLLARIDEIPNAWMDLLLSHTAWTLGMVSTLVICIGRLFYLARTDEPAPLLPLLLLAGAGSIFEMVAFMAPNFVPIPSSIHAAVSSMSLLIASTSVMRMPFRKRKPTTRRHERIPETTVTSTLVLEQRVAVPSLSDSALHDFFFEEEPTVKPFPLRVTAPQRTSSSAERGTATVHSLPRGSERGRRRTS